MIRFWSCDKFALFLNFLLFNSIRLNYSACTAEFNCFIDPDDFFCFVVELFKKALCLMRDLRKNIFL